MIPDGDMTCTLVANAEALMDEEGWDNDPRLFTFYAAHEPDPDGTHVLTAGEFPGFNKAIEAGSLRSVMGMLVRFFSDPKNKRILSKVIDAVPGSQFVGLAVGMEALDADEGCGTPIDNRSVVGLDTAGLVVLCNRLRGQEPSVTVGGPLVEHTKVGGQLIAHLRDIMVPLCAAMPEEQSDLFTVSQVVQIDSAEAFAFE